MVRQIRVKRFKLQKKPEQYDDDDPQAYKGMPAPDKGSSDFTRDEVDRFHDEKIAKLLASGVQMDSDHEDGDDEEEVMALDDSESEEDEKYEDEEEEGSDMESDLEGKKDEDLPSDMAWGNRKKLFYDSDYVAAKGKTQEEVEAEDKEEEEEAKSIQRRLAANLSEEDYDLNLFQEYAVEKDEKSAEKDKKIVKDLDQMSQKEKLKLLKKESPEMLELIQDFKSKLAELKDELQPLIEMVKDGRIPPGKGAEYLQTKQQLYLNYCTNISFYLVLKAKRIPAHNHPVIESSSMSWAAVDARLGPQLRRLLAGELKEVTHRPSSKKGKAPVEAVGEASEEDSDSDDDDEKAALCFYKEVEERLKLKKQKRKNMDPVADEMEENGDEEADNTDAKRGITYEMAKNKGLTPKRKKIYRNPRVKHREKFRRAKIQRKGQVREVRREETRYSGEHSGIRAGLKKSIKLS
ncbi:Something about silencing protein 10 [Merluccius polli]|uniref:Something about silencing protein 10 n=1 Tax=Merluccius polli TaxID=89951 RepID=A0AA47NS98_MERPO|nr:Something about silencing protein 10 [Merluccius polli]